MNAARDDPAAPVDELVRRCHEAARTRGAVISLASFDASGTMTWLGVGNVEGLLVRGDTERSKRSRCAAARLGTMLPPLDAAHAAGARTATRSCSRPTASVTASSAEVHAERDAQEIADAILANWARQRDDCVRGRRAVRWRVRHDEPDPKRAQLEHEYSTALRDASAARARSRSRTRTSSAAWQRARGIGVVELAAIHDHALREVLGDTAPPAEVDQFFAEALSPFEMTHRGFPRGERAARGGGARARGVQLLGVARPARAAAHDQRVHAGARRGSAVPARRQGAAITCAACSRPPRG